MQEHQQGQQRKGHRDAKFEGVIGLVARGDRLRIQALHVTDAACLADFAGEMIMVLVRASA